MKKTLFAVTVCLFFLISCGNTKSEGDYTSETQAKTVDNQAPSPITEAPLPTLSPEKTPEPTPSPTPSPTPVTIIEPSTYHGSGDSVVQLDNRTDIWVLYVKGNSEGRFFSVKGYDSNGKSTELFVNTTDVYEGITLDLSQSTSVLEISAKGEWTIEQRSAFSLDYISQGETYFGTGDSVLLIKSYGNTASVKGNSAGRFFSVKSYGSRNNLMVNTTDVYEGTVMLKDEPIILEITAIGDWQITFN